MCAYMHGSVPSNFYYVTRNILVFSLQFLVSWDLCQGNKNSFNTKTKASVLYCTLFHSGEEKKMFSFSNKFVRK